MQGLVDTLLWHWTYGKVGVHSVMAWIILKREHWTYGKVGRDNVTVRINLSREHWTYGKVGGHRVMALALCKNMVETMLIARFILNREHWLDGKVGNPHEEADG